MSEFTIKTATPTGKTDPTYGDEYYVQFEEDTRAVKMSRKAVPQPGGKENGQIIDGKYGAYFKKDPYQPTPQGGAVNVPAKKWTPIKRDNSDGQRQGMCLNNAANYVNTLEFEKALTDREWAQLVHSYATALYRLGDLKDVEDQPAPAELPIAEAPKAVQDVFGVTPPAAPKTARKAAKKTK